MDELKRITQEELDEIFSNHALWLKDDNLEEHYMAYLCGFDLKGLDFQGKILDNATFKNCDMSGLNLENLSLETSYFLFVNLKGSSFTDSKLTGSTFELCDLTDCNFSKATDTRFMDVDVCKNFIC